MRQLLNDLSGTLIIERAQRVWGEGFMGWHMDLRIKWVLDGDKGKCRFMNLGYITMGHDL